MGGVAGTPELEADARVATRDAVRVCLPTADALAMTGLAAVWLGMVLCVHPAGSFPLADDWAYARSVLAMLERGAIEVRPWTPAIALSHTLWGTLASVLLGFSFPALRASILVLGLAGVVATYALLRARRVGLSLAVVAAATLAVNPIYFHLAGTFMTDVSFVAMATIALWALVRALRTGSSAALWIGGLAALAATLNRQIGIAIPVAFVVAAVVTRRRERLAGFALLAAAGLALLAWELAVGERGGPSLAANVKISEMSDFLRGDPLAVVGRMLRNAVALACYLGIFTLPLSLALAAARPGAIGERSRRGALLLVAALLVGTAIVLAFGPMPLVGNVLASSGIGPATLRDELILDLGNLPQATFAMRFAITVASCLGAMLLLGALWRTVADLAGAVGKDLNGSGRPESVLLTTVAALWVVPLLVAPYFDRYLLPLVPVAMALAVLAPYPRAVVARAAVVPRWGLVLPATLLVAGAVFSVAAVHDYLSWNDARWRAGEWLTTRRDAPASAIDGGFEWNAWYGYDPAYLAHAEHSWYWVADDRWVIAFGPIPGRRTVYRVPFTRWLPPRERGEIVVLERLGSELRRASDRIPRP